MNSINNQEAQSIRDGLLATADLADGVQHGLEVRWARHLDEVRASQRLRYDVFADEMGARLDTPIPGHDIDLFDN